MITRAVLSFLLASMPTALCWLVLESSPIKDQASSVYTPNPAKAPWVSNTQEKMTSINPRLSHFAGLWTMLVYGSLFAWAVLVSQVGKRWTLPLLAVFSLAIGIFLAWPWLFVLLGVVR